MLPTGRNTLPFTTPPINARKTSETSSTRMLRSSARVLEVPRLAGRQVIASHGKVANVPLVQKAVFSIQEIPHKKNAELARTCREWKMQAAQCFDLSLSEVEEKRLVDSMVVTDTLSTSITSSSRVFACKGRESLEGVALVTDKESCLELELLATNPKNLIQRVDSVKGSGTALLYFLFQKCLDEHKTSIQLYSRHSSIEFYMKMGFTILRDNTSSALDEKQNIPMRISAEKIQEILLIEKL
ncbi:MAG: GNAT family N-acetyltransferase [Rhabdochlamydiaceae bacterium]|nr:GNAT family N-acetyltransferase [Rhabdochlamydiaceae bacterium]